MNEKAFEKVERDLNLATGEIKIMGAKGTGTSAPPNDQSHRRF